MRRAALRNKIRKAVLAFVPPSCRRDAEEYSDFLIEEIMDNMSSPEGELKNLELWRQHIIATAVYEVVYNSPILKKGGAKC